MTGLPAAHEITPLKGSMRDRDGEPCLGLSMLDFPITAICRECGGTVRLARYFGTEWQHSTAAESQE